MGYREVFETTDKTSTDPGRIFYTIRREDIGKRFIRTPEILIQLADVIGYVQPADVGKRLIRVQNNAKDSWFWVCEGDAQRDKRLAAEK